MATSHPSLITGIVLLGLVVGIVGCDHATKGLAEAELAGSDPVTVIAGSVDLRYAQNYGIAFSAERYLPEPMRMPLIAASGIFVLLFIAVSWYRRGAVWTWETAAYALIVAGALGNLIDRVARGYVVDFIHIHHWPVFNIADVSIVAGAAALLVAMYRARETKAPPVQAA